ncbi:unnamed protein product [Diatraea saccharalis]|uniref:Uncharacterized protein n=1 Tax=Diatraea saccharalis TaxID=40085 RepID=A0A9P0C392_9NEOP|nr:unnamed protein product [Diatraea saccharalis]
MSEEEVEKWTREVRNKEIQMSPSCSSFEVLDPHDPVISRLATQLFKRTNDYLQGEMSAGQDHYNLLEEINRLTITKYADLKNLAVNLNKTLMEYNEMCKYCSHNMSIQFKLLTNIRESCRGIIKLLKQYYVKS